MRRSPVALALAAACAASAEAPAHGAVRLAKGDADVVGLAVAGGEAVALLDPGAERGPFVAVRSAGRRVRHVASVAPGGAEFPAIAADARGRVVAAWDFPVSGGMRYAAQAVPGGEPRDLHTGTSPARLAVADDGSAVVAHADTTGNVAVTTTPDVARPSRGADPYAVPTTTVLTSDAPHLRHLPLGLALRQEGPLVLDLVQRRGRTHLRVVGHGAPSAPLTAGGGLQDLQGAIAATEDRIHVAYVVRRRLVLATARPGGGWTRRTLPGRGVSGAPALAVAGGRAYVAWAQPGAGGRRDVRAAVVGARVTARRLTRSRTDEGPPLLAAGAGGRVFAAWATARGSGRTPLLTGLR